MTTPERTGTRRPDRNARRKAVTRERILAAARRLFASRGVEQTTIRDIAREADIALGGFYNYFRTKDEVLAELVKDALGAQLALLVQRQQAVHDVAERVTIAHRHLLAAARADPDWGWLLVRLDVSHRVTNMVLGERAMADLREGLESGRFVVGERRGGAPGERRSAPWRHAGGPARRLLGGG